MGYKRNEPRGGAPLDPILKNAGGQSAISETRAGGPLQRQDTTHVSMIVWCLRVTGRESGGNNNTPNVHGAPCPHAAQRVTSKSTRTFRYKSSVVVISDPGGCKDARPDPCTPTGGRLHHPLQSYPTTINRTARNTAKGYKVSGVEPSPRVTRRTTREQDGRPSRPDSCCPESGQQEYRACERTGRNSNLLCWNVWYHQAAAYAVITSATHCAESTHQLKNK